MFNQGGFNSLSYNQLSIDFEINKEDSLNATATEQISNEAELSSSDELIISITGLILRRTIVESDILILTTDETIDIYRETSGLDPPIVEIIESANIDNEITTSDELLVTDKIYLPLGFNQQGFNQSQGRYFEESEKSTRDKFISVSDELLVTDKIYLPLGFNQQGFNQPQGRYFEESEKSDSKNYMGYSDNLSITIDKGTNYNADVFGNDSIIISLLESRALDKNKEISDSLEITFTETADLEVITDSQDTLLVTYEFIAPLGFNQIGFNQAQETYIESGESSKIGQSVVDSFEFNINANYTLNTERTLSDVLEVRSLQNKQGVSVALSPQDTLETVLAEVRALNKPEYVQDSIDFDTYEDSDLRTNLNAIEDLDINISSNNYIASTLMFNYLGKFRRIKKGYVLVSGQWKTIVGYRGVVGNEWKNLKE